MSKREIQLLLEDILESSEKILFYTKGMSFNDFISDDKTIDAVIRNFEIIGEAANRVPEDFKSDHPEIEWNLKGISENPSITISDVIDHPEIEWNHAYLSKNPSILFGGHG